jgi:phosphoribosylglycinamide formyltransferase 1
MSALNLGLQLGFLASHGGTSMCAIVDAIADGRLSGRACAVISNNKESSALQFARARGIAAHHISGKTEGSDDAADVAIARALQEAGAEWLVLSGYMRKLGPVTLRSWRGRILNIHPALLPKFGGKGMYGKYIHEAVIASGETISGITIHLVDGEYDHGEVLAQREIPVLRGDTAESLQQRIASEEPAFYIDVLKSIAAR